MKLKLTNITTLEVNGKPVETKTQEIFVSKNKEGKFIKRERNSTAYFCPKEDGVPIDNDFFWNNIGHWRDKYKHSRIFEDLINKNNEEIRHVPIKRRKVKFLYSLYSFCFSFFCWIMSQLKYYANIQL